jgi:predicted  nucleic acid-binding Zn-ribbon protein
MGDGAFRDASAAIERVASLQQENEQLRGEVAALRAEIEQIREGSDPSAVSKLRAALESERQSRKLERRESLSGPEQRAAQRAFYEVRDARDAAIAKHEQTLAALAAVSAELAAAREPTVASDKELTGVRVELSRVRLELAAAQQRIDELLEAPQPVVAIPENLDAYMKRVHEERDELLETVRQLREQLTSKVRPSLLGSLFGRRGAR